MSVREVDRDEICVGVGRRLLFFRLRRSSELLSGAPGYLKPSREAQNEGQVTRSSENERSRHESTQFRPVPDVAPEMSLRDKRIPYFMLKERHLLLRAGVTSEMIPRLLARGTVSYGALASLLGKSAGLSADEVHSQLVVRARRLSIPIPHIIRAIAKSGLPLADGVREIVKKSDAAFRLLLTDGDLSYLGAKVTPTSHAQEIQLREEIQNDFLLLPDRSLPPEKKSKTFQPRTHPVSSVFVSETEAEDLLPYSYDPSVFGGGLLPAVDKVAGGGKKKGKEGNVYHFSPSVRLRQESTTTSCSKEDAAEGFAISSVNLTPRTRRGGSWPATTASLTQSQQRKKTSGFTEAQGTSNFVELDNGKDAVREMNVQEGEMKLKEKLGYADINFELHEDEIEIAGTLPAKSKRKEGGGDRKSVSGVHFQQRLGPFPSLSEAVPMQGWADTAVTVVGQRLVYPEEVIF
mmetsp:Transcript_35680/g.92999  ORF Transcript_35680/g.92999 Transcript_35680/m.92999 type:complete len:462 (-) Transcript_35680:31-1416(-)